MEKTPDLHEFFPELGQFEHRALLDGVMNPWEALPRIKGYIEEFLKGKEPSSLPDGLEVQRSKGGDAYLFCHAPVEMAEDTYIEELAIFIGKGTHIESSALIRANCIIGRDCDVRHGAYLRGDFVTGNHCTLGHTSEVKGSIIMDHSEMGHFNYIGDSIIGSYVNIGAGTKLANLKFRKPEPKKEVSFPEITFSREGGTVHTGLNKLGAVIGDYCETGCNSVLSPATLLCHECWIYPNYTVPSGIYEAKTFLGPKELKAKPRPLPK